MEGMLPQELLANESIRYQLKRGLDMMFQAAEGMKVVNPGLNGNVTYLKVRDQRQFEAQHRAASQEAGLSSAVEVDGVPEMILKEVVKAYAEQHELLFKPKPHRIHEGLQIYRFGLISIVIDSLNDKIYAQKEDCWSLVSLDGLLKMHHNTEKMRR